MILALVLVGCVSGTTSSKLPESHPANPAAAQAIYPPLAPFLMADTNLVAMANSSTKNSSTNAPEHEHHQEAKPEAKTPHKHDTK